MTLFRRSAALGELPRHPVGESTGMTPDGLFEFLGRHQKSPSSLYDASLLRGAGRVLRPLFPNERICGKLYRVPINKEEPSHG